MTVSIIIPTLNEEKNISKLIKHLMESGKDTEIIVVDAESTDNTKKEAGKFGITVLNSVTRSRASQMNIGADYASGEFSSQENILSLYR